MVAMYYITMDTILLCFVYYNNTCTNRACDFGVLEVRATGWKSSLS